MLTAETITDDQLHDLREAAAGVDFHLYRIAQTAIEDTLRYREAMGGAQALATKVLANWSMSISIAEAKILAPAVIGLNTEARACCAQFLNEHGNDPRLSLNLTAETITDTQIRELANIYRGADSEIVDNCIDALVYTGEAQHAARLRCAEILNERAKASR